jgi:hypothetical protein
MAPLIRILARILAGFLIGAGYMTQGAAESVFSDPAFDMAIGAVIIAATEGWYWLARKFGWRT